MLGTNRGRSTARHRWVYVTVAVAAVVLIVGTYFALSLTPQSATPTTPPLARLVDESRSLGAVFHPGVILSGASNSTTTFLGGIGVYVQPTGFSLPVFAAVTAGSSSLTVANETTTIESDFLDGGVYAIGWNGSTWLIGGQRSPGGSDEAALVALDGGTATNLTSRVASYFHGGGIWAIAWNGTSWLIGGNSSSTATLLAWDGGPVTDLSSRLVSHGSKPWVQLIAGNGTETLVGGHGLFGLWTGSAYEDLLPASPFQGGGVYSAAWNGTSWLVGGGGRELVFVRGGNVTDALTLPPAFDQVALMVTATAHGWFVAGKGLGAEGSYAPELVFWAGSAGASPTDYSASLPSSFDGGEVQGGVPAPELGPNMLLLVGEGAYNVSTGYGTGALALLQTTAA